LNIVDKQSQFGQQCPHLRLETGVNKSTNQHPICLQCFYTIDWASKRALKIVKIEWWDAGMIFRMEQGARDSYMV